MTLASYGVTFAVVILLTGVLRLEGQPVVTIASLGQEIAFAGTAVVWLRRSGASVRDDLGLGPARGEDLGAGVGMGFVMLVAVDATVAATLAIADAIAGEVEPPDPFEGLSHGWLIAAVLIGVCAAPICEEILFRGFLYQGLRRSFGPGRAALLSAAGFAWAHADVLRMPGTFVAGVILASLYERRRTLIAPIAAHTVLNVIASIGVVRGT